jgi:hypothetical protein
MLYNQISKYAREHAVKTARKQITRGTVVSPNIGTMSCTHVGSGGFWNLLFTRLTMN